MTFEIAKRNRLQSKFDYTTRDWHDEWNDPDGAPRSPQRSGRATRHPSSLWDRFRSWDCSEWPEAESSD